jgi:ribosomal protein S18 acetylase RimI-like enzyme
MTTTFKTIDTPELAEDLRGLRNACAEWMTKDTTWISPSRQQEFFRTKILTGKIEGFLMYEGDHPVGYGLIVWDEEGRAWSSTGTNPDSRLRGFGKAVMVENTKRAHAHGAPMWAEVRCDNAGQQKIMAALGFLILDTFERDGLMVDLMVCHELSQEYR